MVLGFMMLAIFAILLPCLDMLLLVWVTRKLAAREHISAARILRLSRVIGKLSMLDVCVIGIIIVCFAAGMYESMGVAFYTQSGVAAHGSRSCALHCFLDCRRV